MKSTIETLHRAQALLRKDSNATDEQREAALAELRADVPAPILAHYLRLLANGRNGVALVRHGVCCECHIRVPVSTIGSLVKPTDLHLCENCGCYLILPAGELESFTASLNSRRAMRLKQSEHPPMEEAVGR